MYDPPQLSTLYRPFHQEKVGIQNSFLFHYCIEKTDSYPVPLPLTVFADVALLWGALGCPCLAAGQAQQVYRGERTKGIMQGGQLCGPYFFRIFCVFFSAFSFFETVRFFSNYSCFQPIFVLETEYILCETHIFFVEPYIFLLAKTSYFGGCKCVFFCESMCFLGGQLEYLLQN